MGFSCAFAPFVWAVVCFVGQEQPAKGVPAPEGERFHQAVEWSPDGRWIAFSELTGGEPAVENWSLQVIAPDGSGRREVVKGAIFFSWAPDGRRIVFDSKRDGNEDLWIVGVDAEGLVRVTEHDARDMQPAWSPKGDRIAFVSDREGNEEIHVLELASGALARLTTDEAKDFNPAWAPDGESLVFFREKGDGLDQVYVVRADGSGERRVTDGTHHGFYPSFLPDGRVGFTRVDENREKQLAWSRVDGSERGIVPGLPVSFARWSPDGGRIAYVAGRWPRSAVYVAAADGSGVRELVN